MAEDRPRKSALHVDPANSSVPVEPSPGSGPRRRDLDLRALADGVVSGDRAVLGRAITLIESSRPDHQQLSQALLTELLPKSGGSIRVGITGVPGAGKSTFIETLGCSLTAAGHRVAVLAVDPSSGVSGGSILGDKTRMARLAADDQAFIRPSPSAGTLGGVARKTRETLLLCEAAGFDVLLVETVGVGQSETVVAEMTDVFCALLLAGAGDELQGIKRGLLELVDVIAVNKADGDNRQRVERTVSEIDMALHIFRGADRVPVLPCSALADAGVAEVWSALRGLHDARRASGELGRKRRDQSVRWMWSLIREDVDARLRGDADLATMLARLEDEVRDGQRPALLAAREILSVLLRDRTGDDTSDSES